MGRKESNQTNKQTCLIFASKWSFFYFQPILAAIFVTIATVKVESILDLYTLTIVLKPLSHQRGFLTVILRCPKKLQNAEMHAVRTQASPQQRIGIAIGHGGVV